MKLRHFLAILIVALPFIVSTATAQVFFQKKENNKKPVNLSGVYKGSWKDLQDNTGKIEMKIYSRNDYTTYGGFFISTNSLGHLHTGSIEFQRENNYLNGYFNPTVYDRYDSVRSSFNCFLTINGIFKKDKENRLVIQGEAVGGSCEENTIIFFDMKLEEAILEEFITAQ